MTFLTPGKSSFSSSANRRRRYLSSPYFEKLEGNRVSFKVPRFIFNFGYEFEFDVGIGRSEVIYTFRGTGAS